MSSGRHLSAAGAGELRRMFLFVVGQEANSMLAQQNLREICAAEPRFEFDVQIIDVLEDYQAALEYKILVTPCLILTEPHPEARVVGTLKDADKVRAALRLGARF